MRQRLRALSDNYRSALLVAALLIMGNAAFSQNYTSTSAWGYKYRNVWVPETLSIPNDTFAIPAPYQNQPFIAYKDSLIYLWSPSLHRWNTGGTFSSTPGGGSGGGVDFLTKQNFGDTATYDATRWWVLQQLNSYTPTTRFLDSMQAARFTYLKAGDTTYLHNQLIKLSTNNAANSNLLFANGLVYSSVTNTVSALYQSPMWNANRFQGYPVDAVICNGCVPYLDSANRIIRWRLPDSATIQPILDRIDNIGFWADDRYFDVKPAGPIVGDKDSFTLKQSFLDDITNVTTPGNYVPYPDFTDTTNNLRTAINNVLANFSNYYTKTESNGRFVFSNDVRSLTAADTTRWGAGGGGRTYYNGYGILKPNDSTFSADTATIYAGFVEKDPWKIISTTITGDSVKTAVVLRSNGTTYNYSWVDNGGGTASSGGTGSYIFNRYFNGPAQAASFHIRDSAAIDKYLNAGAVLTPNLRLLAVTVLNSAAPDGSLAFNSATNRYYAHQNGIWRTLPTDADVVLNQSTQQPGTSFNISGSGTATQFVTPLMVAATYGGGSTSLANNADIRLQFNTSNSNFWSIENVNNAAFNMSSSWNDRGFLSFMKATTMNMTSNGRIAMIDVRPTLTFDANTIAGNGVYGYRFRPVVTDNSPGAIGKVWSIYTEAGHEYFKDLDDGTGVAKNVTVVNGVLGTGTGASGGTGGTADGNNYTQGHTLNWDATAHTLSLTSTRSGLADIISNTITLPSGTGSGITDIKTLNGTSLVGTGNVDVSFNVNTDHFSDAGGNGAVSLFEQLNLAPAILDTINAKVSHTEDNALVKTGTGIYTRKAWQTAADAATVTFNAALGYNWKVTLGGNRTVAFSNLQDGDVITLRLIQDATGGRTVTWPSAIKWAGGTAPALTVAANSRDIISLIYDAATGFLYQSGFDVR